MPHGKAQQNQHGTGEYLGLPTFRFGGSRCEVRTNGTPPDIPLREKSDMRTSWSVGAKIAGGSGLGLTIMLVIVVVP